MATVATPHLPLISTAKMDRLSRVCMPAHSSHLLQPLDVGCFSPLKLAYREQIMDLIKLGVHHVDKPQFLSAFYLLAIKLLQQRISAVALERLV
jgi:hypothetical protein